jgi:hypothetical protein
LHWQKLVYGSYTTRNFHEYFVLASRHTQNICHPLGDLPRGAAFIPLNFLDRRKRTTDPICQYLLGQVERFALTADPIAKGSCSFRLLLLQNKLFSRSA